MRSLLLMICSVYILNALNLNFEQRQDLISNIKETILQEELISEATEKYITENYMLPIDLSVLNLTLETLELNSLESNYFKSFVIDTLNEKLAIQYTLKSEVDDTSLIKLYEANTFRDRTFVYEVNDTKSIRMRLNDDFARHLYGLIKFNGAGLNSIALDTCLFQICMVDNIITIKNSSGLKLYEYEKDNYKSGPMMITDDTTLHTSEEFDFVPNGVNFMDENGVQYVKTDDGIVPLQ